MIKNPMGAYLVRKETMNLVAMGAVLGCCGYWIHWGGWCLVGVLVALMVAEYRLWWRVGGQAAERVRCAEVASWEWVVKQGRGAAEQEKWLNELRASGGLEFCKQKGICEGDWPRVRDDGVIETGMFAGGFYGGGVGAGVYAYGLGGDLVAESAKTSGLEMSLYQEGLAQGMPVSKACGGTGSNPGMSSFD